MDGGSQDPRSRGLFEKEAAARLKAEGPNALPQPDRRTFIGIVLEILREPMFALLLQRLLRSQEGDPLAGLAPAFFAEASGLIETPWASAAVPDLAFSETEGQRPPDLERTLRFRRALNRLMAADPAVHQKVLEVQHLMKPRSVLLDPALVERVQAMMGEA